MALVDAAVGAGFGEALSRLSDAVNDMIHKAVIFEPNLKRLRNTLSSITPLMEEIDKLNRILNRPKEETSEFIQQLKDGETLVQGCLKISGLNLYAKIQHESKIEELDQSILRFFQVNLQLQMARDQKETLVMTHLNFILGNAILEKLNSIAGNDTNVEQSNLVPRNAILEQLNLVALLEHLTLVPRNAILENSNLVPRNAILENSNLVASSGGSGGSCPVPKPPVVGEQLINGTEWWGSSVPKPPDGIVGMDVPLKALKMELFKDDVSVLVLTAPPGCGKTTLVKMLGHDEEVKVKFQDRIFFVTVSNTLDPKVIVQSLFNHMSIKAPEFRCDEDAINHLKKLLNQIVSNASNPILLILDDLWSGSESLLEKFAFPRFAFLKILVTSRFAFPRFHSYNLKPLNDKEAMELFRHSANSQVENSPIRKDIVIKIVRLCGGLPLALTVIGRSLRGQPVEVWESREKKWSTGLSILDSNKDLLLQLESSLDFLDEGIKKCFMDLGSFPEDQKIPAPALIDMWVELYGVDEDGAIANLHELNKWNLASLVVSRNEADGYYNEDFIIQHDLLRELAIHQSCQNHIGQREKLIVDISGNNFPEWWATKQEQQTVNARLLSISTGEKFSSNWCDMQPPEVEVLVLNFQTKDYSLPVFVEKMGKLKVLIVTNNDFFPAQLSNFQLLGFLHNLKRIRLENVSVPSLCKNPIQLSSLEKMSLVMCSIGQAFRNCTIQISDALPKLVEINIDYCKDLVELPAGLRDIVTLKKLNITNCHKLSTLPEGIGKLVNLEVLRLSSCTNLSKLPESIRYLHKLSFLDISDCLSLTKLPKHIGELCNLKVFRMNGCSGLSCGLPPTILDFEQLEVVICDEDGAKLWDHIKDYCTNIEVKITENNINLNWLANKDF